MHPGSDRQDAFRMWVEGRSYEEIAAKMNVAKGTVVRWAERDKWKVRADKIKLRANEKLDESLSSVRARLAKQIRKYRKHLGDQILNLEANSLEGGVHAMVNLIRTEIQLLTPEKTPTDRIEYAKNLVPRVVMTMVKLLSTNADIAAVIETKRAEIIKLVSEDAIKFANESFGAEP
jgi:uncharacterized protein YjcR